MFTGIVQGIGVVKECKRHNGGMECRIDTRLSRMWKKGESILVSGICSTILSSGRRYVSVSYMPETMARTTAYQWKSDQEVNIEAPLRVGTELSGHFVQGHVDCEGTVESIESSANETRITIGIPREFSHLITEKGSIAIDGVSLTVADMNQRGITVACIPHTLKATIAHTHTKGTKVNVECDMLAKHVYSILTGKK